MSGLCLTICFFHVFVCVGEYVFHLFVSDSLFVVCLVCVWQFVYRLVGLCHLHPSSRLRYVCLVCVSQFVFRLSGLCPTVFFSSVWFVSDCKCLFSSVWFVSVCLFFVCLGCLLHLVFQLSGLVCAWLFLVFRLSCSCLIICFDCLCCVF